MSNYPLLGTRIVIDEEKVLREGKYDLKEIYELIDEMARDSGMIKKDKHTYLCRGNSKDLSSMGIFIYTNLIKRDWFTLNIKEWEWLSEKEGNFNLIAKNKARNKGVWA